LLLSSRAGIQSGRLSSQSSHPEHTAVELSERIGAWMTAGGCFFRVWAPNASGVRVLVQDGPYWEAGDETIIQSLVRGGDYWSGTVAGMTAWRLYRYEITNGTEVFQTLDPAAR